MAEGRRRIAVIGGRSPLGRRVADALHDDPGVEAVHPLEGRLGRRAGEDARVDIVSFDPDHRPLAEFLASERIDTLVQCALVADRCGRQPSASTAGVIETMNLGAAVGHEDVSVRSWVVASSTAVYPIGSMSPRFQSERSDFQPTEASLAASILEAEDYARDVAERLPHVNVAILRLQHLAGPGSRDSLYDLLGRRVLPAPAGFDPLIQLLHVDDAVSGLAFAAREELAGVYNLASAGVIHWQDALRALDRPVRTAAPFSLGPLSSLVDRLGGASIPSDLVDLMWFGHAVDTHKLERAGWKASHDQRSILSELAGSR